MTPYDIILTVLTILLALYLISFALYIVRVLKGPTIPDRVLALDSLGYDLAAFMLILSIYLNSPMMAVCALSLALWIYALDIYVAKYLEAKEVGG
uniref:pH regulation protein F n=1 Tax=Ignisphaera aggregans TaxID=334771 RepID=A0A7J2U2B1_9CREN